MPIWRVAFLGKGKFGSKFYLCHSTLNSGCQNLKVETHQCHELSASSPREKQKQHYWDANRYPCLPA